jgi:plasmid stabilization system protein ParE
MNAGRIYAIRWTEKARQDLFDIGDYIARDNPAVAARFTRSLMERCTGLAKNPWIGRVVPEVAREDIRELIYGNYRIVYRLLEDEVHILTAFEGHKLFSNVDFA